MNRNHNSKYLCIALIVFAFITTTLYAQSTSVTPSQRMKDAGYLQIKPITFNAFTMTGNMVFINSSPPYSIQVPLSRVYDDFGQHQLTTTDYQSQVDGVLGYGLNSIVSTFPVSKVRVQLQVHGSSMIVRLKITLIVTTAIFTNYMQFGQKTINSPMSPQFFVNQDVYNTKFIPLVKSFITTYTGTLGSLPQSMGFKTHGSKVFDVNNTMVYQVYFDKSPSVVGNFTVSVTYVVIQINQIQFKKTAQFNNLQMTWTHGYTTMSSQIIMPSNFESTYVNDLMLSPSEFPFISTQKSFYSIITDNTGITISTNNIGGIAQYSFIDFKDLQCPTTYPYKKKGDTLCYRCPNPAMILVNGNSLWTQLNSTFTNPICIKLNLILSMYQFDSSTSKVKTVCGYCRQCSTTQFYLQQGICKQCSTNIVGCTQCSSNQTCTKCQSGYLLQQSGACELCNSSMLNCQQCNSNISCQKCVIGFYLQQQDNNNISKCTSCNIAITGCQLCSIGSKCDKCLTGYFINSLNKCQSCSQHRQNCLQCNDLSGQCTKCQPGYFPDSGVCKLCNQTLSNCIQCTSKTNCILCLNTTSYQLKYSNPNNLQSDKYCLIKNIQPQKNNTTQIKPQPSTTTTTIVEQQSQLKKILPFALGIGLPLIIFAVIVFFYIKKIYYDQQSLPSSEQSQQNSNKINSNQLHLVTTQQLTQEIVNINSPTILSKLQSLIGKLLDRFDTETIRSRLDINLTANY